MRGDRKGLGLRAQRLDVPVVTLDVLVNLRADPPAQRRLIDPERDALKRGRPELLTIAYGLEALHPGPGVDVDLDVARGLEGRHARRLVRLDLNGEQAGDFRLWR